MKTRTACLFVLLAALAMPSAAWSATRDPVIAYCKALKVGDTIAALVTQENGPPGNPILHNYSISGRTFTDWRYSDGVVLTWHNGYISQKVC
jgi:hypothetical protein